MAFQKLGAHLEPINDVGVISKCRLHFDLHSLDDLVLRDLPPIQLVDPPPAFTRKIASTHEVCTHSVWAMPSVLLLHCGHLAVALQVRPSEPLHNPAALAPALR